MHVLFERLFWFAMLAVCFVLMTAKHIEIGQERDGVAVPYKFGGVLMRSLAWVGCGFAGQRLAHLLFQW